MPGVVLPVLGALPDTLIVGVSGLGGGSREEVQHELAVGIGTLAGSTVRSRTVIAQCDSPQLRTTNIDVHGFPPLVTLYSLWSLYVGPAFKGRWWNNVRGKGQFPTHGRAQVALLTLAWGGSLLLGRCDLDDEGRAVPRTLTRGAGLLRTGVTADADVRSGAGAMLASLALYAIVQARCRKQLQCPGLYCSSVGGGTDAICTQRTAVQQTLTCFVQCSVVPWQSPDLRSLE